MGRSARMYPVSTIEQITKRLQEIQPKPKQEIAITTKDAIMTLKPAIKSMQQKGYTPNEILTEIRNGGMNLGLSALKSVFTRQKRRRDEKNTEENFVTKTAEPKGKTDNKAATAFVTKTISKAQPIFVAKTGEKESASSLQDPDEK